MNTVRVMVLVLMATGFTGTAGAQSIVVDHTSIAQFDQIPAQYLEAAKNLRFLFMNRSVGVNTNEALDCLAASSYGTSASHCRQDFQFTNGSWRLTLQTATTYAAGQVPPYIRFDASPGKYDRSRWSFYLFYSAWETMASDFITGLSNRSIPVQVHPTNERIQINPLDFDVISFQFSYLNVDDGSRILDYFTNRPGSHDDAYDLEREISENLTNLSPRRYFVYFTSSLGRSIGTQVSQDFNNRMRDWCRTNNCILFDFADIEAYDMAGRPCYDDRDGVSYTHPNNSSLTENYPDDGLNIPAICQEKTVEVENGHLGTAQGYISIGKGLWVLLARIAGWNPGGTGTPVPTAPQNLRIR